MKKYYLVCTLLLYSIYTQAQQNLVPNPGFEDANPGKYPQCNDYYSKHGRSEAMEFDNDIAYWKQALYQPNNFLAEVRSSDWEGPDCSSTPACAFNTISQRCIRFGDEEGIRVGLRKDGAAYKLKGGKTYTFRIKIFAQSNSYTGIRVMFATWGEHWNSKKKKNTKFNDAANVGETNMLANYGACTWVSYSKTFQVPQDMDNKLENLIILNNFGAGSNVVYLDDVELYEGDCSEDLRVENKNYYFKEAPYEHQHIYAGYDAGVPNDAGNVVVKNTGNVTYKAVQLVKLLPGFSTEPNATFKAFLAPCNRNCFYPTVFAGENTVLCGSGTTYQIGLSALGIDNSSYNWTADPPSALSYLSSTTVHNPVFTTPSTGIGVIRYTQTATNNCGEVAQSDVYIEYDAQPSPNPSISVSNVNQGTYVNFDMSFNSHTEMIKVEILDANNNVLRTYTLYNFEDFNCCSFHWQVPDYYSFCYDYNVRVSSKNYCYENWSTPVTFAWNPTHYSAVVLDPNFPNVFTPNGDGVNDLLWHNAWGAISYSVYIYNRDGALVYKKVDQSTYGNTSHLIWDGTCNGPMCSNNGVVSEAVYYCVVSYYGCNGELSYRGISGDVQVFTGPHKMEEEHISKEEKVVSSGINRVSIFPNPTYGQLYINSPDKIKNIEIIDHSGRIVYSRTASENRVSVQLENIASGIYFVRTLLEDGKQQMDKILLLESN
jgi:hypothetical protein